MSHPVSQQLNAIHAMLSAGHRNLRIERHSLILWGLAGGGLFLVSTHIFTPDDIPVLEERALAWLLLIVGVLGGVGAVDLHWTRRVKEARDEAWSFIHRQVLKVWWLLMGMAALLTFAMFFFGGGYMVCTVWMVALGLGLYIHGLFSEELLEWTGVLIILIGIGSLGFHLSYETLRWIAAAVFGLGLPFLAVVLDRGLHRSAFFRLAQVLVWLIAVMLIPLVAHRQANAALPEVPVVSLEEFRRTPTVDGPRIVSLPAGTAVPVELELDGDLFTAQGQGPAVLPLTLTEPVEVLVVDGKPSGEARLPGESWQRAREARWISIPWLKAEVTSERGPVVRGQLIVQFRQK